MKGKICENRKFGTSEQKLNFENLLLMSTKESWSIIRVLEEIQNIYGFLPQHILEHYSCMTKKPLNEIYGVATFYSQFSLIPKGKYVISVCIGTACYVIGADLVLEKFCRELNIKPGQCTEDGLFTIDETRCLGCCGIAPVVMVNDDVFRTVKVADVEGIIKQYKEKN